MKKISQLVFVVSVVFGLYSCREKKGIDKIKEGVSEVSDDFSDEVEEESKEAKKIKIKFGK